MRFASPSQQPVTCLVAAILLTLFTIVLFAPHILQGTALIWNNTFMAQFYVWNLISGCFVETNVIKLMVSFAGVMRFGADAEDTLGMLGFALYLVAVAAACGMLTSAGIFVLYIVTRLEYLLSLEVHGFFGLLSALAVAVSLDHPHEPLLSVVPGFKVRHLPITMVALSAALYGLGVKGMATDFPFVCVGSYVGWAYLRFFHSQQGGQAGDVSEHFQLVMFFPPFTRRYLRPFCDFAYGVALLLGLFKDRKQRQPGPPLDQRGDLRPSTVPLPPAEVRDPVAERRRAKAMKLLDEKFAKLNSKQVDRWEDEEEGGAPAKDHPPPARPKGLDITPVLAKAAPAKGAESGQQGPPASGKGGPLRLSAHNKDDDDDWGVDDGELEAKGD